MKTNFKYGLLVLSLFISKMFFACICNPIVPVSEELFKNYNVIFYGKVDAVSEIDAKGNAKATFLIKELYKGNVQQNVALEFDASSDCMMSFETGQQWLIYAVYQRFDELTVNICSHSRKLIIDGGQDYYQLAAGRSFVEETEFLRKYLSVQPFEIQDDISKQQINFKPHNDQPSGMNKLLLLLSSFIIMLIVFIITRKK